MIANLVMIDLCALPYLLTLVSEVSLMARQFLVTVEIPKGIKVKQMEENILTVLTANVQPGVFKVKSVPVPKKEKSGGKR